MAEATTAASAAAPDAMQQLFALALQAMNGITLLGAVFVKAPQLVQIHRVQSVAGVSEQMVVGEVVSNTQVLKMLFALVTHC